MSRVVVFMGPSVTGYLPYPKTRLESSFKGSRKRGSGSAGDHSACRSRVRLDRAACISDRVRALGASELSDDEDDDEDNGRLPQSSAHGSSSGSPEIREALP